VEVEARKAFAVTRQQVISKKRGPKPKPRVEFPEPLWTHWDEPDTFSGALDLHMRCQGDFSVDLQAVAARPVSLREQTDAATGGFRSR
jgi:hypothetical protein